MGKRNAINATLRSLVVPQNASSSSKSRIDMRSSARSPGSIFEGYADRTAPTPNQTALAHSKKIIEGKFKLQWD
jgi:hypothetical protein